MKKKQLKNCRLYVVIDEKTAAKKALWDIAKAAVSGGADIIQLRPKKETLAKDILKTALKIRRVTDKSGRLFIINDRVDIAYAINADGVHLGQDDLPFKAAREILGKGKIIGLSTHSLPQAVSAQRLRADYISVGPVFRTPTKKEYKAVGLGLVKKVNKRIKTPFFAIGGIDINNINKVLKSGAKRIAVVRAVVSAKNPKKATRRLYDAVRIRKTK